LFSGPPLLEKRRGKFSFAERLKPPLGGLGVKAKEKKKNLHREPQRRHREPQRIGDVVTLPLLLKGRAGDGLRRRECES
jgi:hypothetical protein